MYTVCMYACTYAKMFIPHSVQAYKPPAELLQQFLVGDVHVKLYVILEREVFAQVLHIFHPDAVFFVPTGADKDESDL